MCVSEVELGDYNPLQHDANYLNGCDFLPKAGVYQVFNMSLLGITKLIGETDWDESRTFRGSTLFFRKCSNLVFTI